VLWMARGGVVGAGVLNGVAESAQAALTVLIHRRRFGHVRARFRPRLAARLARQAWLPALAALAAMVYLVGDRVLLWRFTSRAEVGVYEAVSRIPLAFAVLPAALASAAFPAISGRDRARARRIYREALVLMVTLAVPLAVGGAVLANPGVALLYPAEYARIARPFAATWMIVGAVIFVSYVSSSALLALGRTTELARITASLAAGNIVLNLVAVPWLGTRGAAAVMLVTQTAGLVVYARTAGRDLGVPGPWSVLRPPIVIASAVAGIVAWWTPSHVVVRAAAGLVAYAGILAALGGWPSDAMHVLREGLAEPEGPLPAETPAPVALRGGGVA
jgi:O-antigen/teichoic acid export membrane protein